MSRNKRTERLLAQLKRRRERRPLPPISDNHRAAVIALGSSGMRAYAQLAASDPRFKIFYVIPHATQDLREASLFGWFTPGLHEAAGPLILASILPADIREPFASQQHILMHRELRFIWKFATPLQLDALAEVQSHIPSPFRVYITTQETVSLFQYGMSLKEGPCFQHGMSLKA